MDKKGLSTLTISPQPESSDGLVPRHESGGHRHPSDIHTTPRGTTAVVWLIHESNSVRVWGRAMGTASGMASLWAERGVERDKRISWPTWWLGLNMGSVASVTF